MVLGDWGRTPTSGKGILYVQMHCLPISDTYVMSVESYARSERKRLLMRKEIQSIWGIRKNGKYKI